MSPFLFKKFFPLLGFLLLFFLWIPNVVDASTATINTNPVWVSSPATLQYMDNSFTVSWGPSDVSSFYWTQYNNNAWSPSWTWLTTNSGSLSFTPSALGWGVGWHALGVLGYYWNGSAWDNGSTAYTNYVWVTDRRPPASGGIVTGSPASATLDQNVSFSWSGISGADDYWIAYWTPSNNRWNYSDKGAATSFSQTPRSLGLSEGYFYYFLVRGCNTDSGGGVQCGDWTNANALYVPNNLSTLLVTAPQPAPTSASITATPNPVSTTQNLHVSWRGNNTPTSYIVYIDGNPNYFGGTTTWDRTGTTPGTYTLSVQACNSIGCSPISSGLTLTVTAAVPTINSFTASNNGTPLSATGGLVMLTWATVNTTSCTLTGGGLNQTVPTSATSYSVGNVTLNTTFNLTCQ